MCLVQLPLIADNAKRLFDKAHVHDSQAGGPAWQQKLKSLRRDDLANAIEIGRGNQAAGSAHFFI